VCFETRNTGAVSCLFRWQNIHFSNVKYKALYDYNFTSVATWPVFIGNSTRLSMNLSDISKRNSDNTVPEDSHWPVWNSTYLSAEKWVHFKTKHSFTWPNSLLTPPIALQFVTDFRLLNGLLTFNSVFDLCVQFLHSQLLISACTQFHHLFFGRKPNHLSWGLC
jgi:hypothetical protein